jgi:hypothetical protein
MMLGANTRALGMALPGDVSWGHSVASCGETRFRF